VLASLRLSLGSIYTMAFGFREGVDIPADYGDSEIAGCYQSGTSYPYACSAKMFKGDSEADSAVLAVIGPEVSFLSFRFGDKREMELESWQGLIMPVGRQFAFNTGIGFRYLFLD